MSVNDGVAADSGSLQVTLSGLSDAHVYDVQVVAMPAVSSNNGDLTIAAGGVSQVRSYASFRPHVNTDPPPFTNSDDVLVSPFASQPSLVPADFENLSTDGAGNLTITLTDQSTIPLNAIYLTAKATQHLVNVVRPEIAGEEPFFQFWANGIPPGQFYHVRSSTDLQLFAPMNPPQQMTDSTNLPLVIPVDPDEERMFFQVYGGAE